MQNNNTYITSYTKPYSAIEIIFFLQIISAICDALHDFVPFVQFKKHKNTHGGKLLLVLVSIWGQHWHLMG